MKARLLLLAILLSAVCDAGDWPMYRYNAERQGYTSEELPEKLSLVWVYQGPAPRSAWVLGWGRTGNQPSGIEFDRVNQPIAAGELVIFGSSGDGKVYALDAATGAEKWVFYTGAPIRFAPAAWKERVFAGSDDGYLYCLELKTGKLAWKHRGGPSDEKVLGNEYAVSRWPIRGGVAVKDDTVFFGAGCWPIDRAYLCALDAATGKEKWKAVTGGPTPDKSEYTFANRGFAGQGYVAVGEKRAILTSGHTAPALYDREAGKFMQLINSRGDAAVVVDNVLAAMGGGFGNPETGGFTRTMDSRCFRPINTTVACERIYGIIGNRICEIDRKTLLPPEEKDGKKKRVGIGDGISGFRVDQHSGFMLIGAGSRLYTGGTGMVHASSMEEKKLVWRAKVEGEARGLAAADGRLIVTTTKGYVYCFAGGKEAEAKTITSKRKDAPGDPAWEKAADEILEQAGFSEGYCVDLGCGGGKLALALARKSKLTIVAVEKDAEKAAAARLLLDRAGVYGERVMVIEADPAASGLPKWFANLVVSGRSVEGGAAPAVEGSRIQRPYDGVTVFGKAGAMKKNVRGPLKGAGNWTHYLADAANTNCSDDTALKAPLRTHWYHATDSGGAVPHVIGSAPLFVNGRLYTMYLWGVRAVDPYNGRYLWKHPLKGLFPFWPVSIPSAMRYGYMCADDESVYVRLPSKILRIDGTTGELRGEYPPPGETEKTSNAWSHIAYDDGTLYASPGGRFTFNIGASRHTNGEKYAAHPEAGAVTALDPETGDVKWTYTAESSIPIPTIVVGGGRVYLIDRPFKEKIKGRYIIEATGPGNVVALDGKTGSVLWKQPATSQGAPVMALSVEHGVLVQSYHMRPKGGRIGTGLLVAMQCSDGKELWKIEKEHHGSYPFIVGDTLHTQPHARDILTGKARTNPATGETWCWKRTHSKSCGDLASSRNIVAFRGSSLAYINLRNYLQTEYFGNVRPGCQINAVPAGGLLLMPEGGPCGCAYNKAWVALQGVE